MSSISLFCTKGIHPDCRRNFSKKKDKAAEVPFTEEQLKNTFRRFDTNQDGRLSREELKNAFTSMGSRLPAGRAFLALRHGDENGDGFIDEEELDKLVKYASKLGYFIK